MHRIKISNFGPIKECEMDVNQFTVLTGPQASGKSTIAKAIYFFRTIKDDIMDLILKNKEQKPPLKLTLESYLLRKLYSLYDKFSKGFQLKYIYGEEVFIEVFNSGVIKTSFNDERILSKFYFGNKINIFLENVSNLSYPIDDAAKNELSDELNELFHDHVETIYIPAGRVTTALLSEQLTPIFMSMDDRQRGTIEYSFRKYFELILKIKPWFEKNTVADNFYQKIIKAEYKYENFQERLYFNDNQFMPLSFASSGQQEAVWILNILNYYISYKKIFLIVEEPEAHLYPESQMHMTDALSLFVNGGGNSGLITTHSPYILGELNNLILCEKTAKKIIDDTEIKKIIDERAWVNTDNFQAFHIDEGIKKQALSEKSGFIKDDLIDGASDEINRRGDELIKLFHGKDGKDE